MGAMNSNRLTFAVIVLIHSAFHAFTLVLPDHHGSIYAKSTAPPRRARFFCRCALFAAIENINNNDDDDNLQNEIDTFLCSEYDRPFAEDAPSPRPGLSPRATVEAALRSLRDLNKPEPAHGAAIFQRFCAPLSRSERWGGGASPMDPWKQVLRGAITPTMLARRIRASIFSVLLDWTKLDVTDGYSMEEDLIGVPSVSFINAALFFRDGMEPCIVQFTLRRFGRVWLIDTARVSKKELFVQSNETNWKDS